MPRTARGALVRRAVWWGAVGGICVIYLVMVGLAGAFQNRPAVTGVITLGELMLAAVPFLVGYALTARLRQAPVAASPATSLAYTGAAGAVTGLLLGLFTFMVSAVDISGVFISVDARTVDLLSLGQESVVGALMLLVAGIVLALLGGGLRLTSDRARGAIIVGLMTLIFTSLLQPLLVPVLGQLDLRAVATFVYQGGGVDLLAAPVLLIAGAAFSWGLSSPRRPMRDGLAGMSEDRRRVAGPGLMVLAIIGLLLLPLIGGSFVSLVLVNVGLFVMLALGLNIVVGYAGLLDLGYVAFYAIGAYVMAILTAPSSVLGGWAAQIFGVEWGFWVALPFVMLAAGVVGLLIGAPVLRLRGDYLAIVTLGFGEIARVLFLSSALEPWLGGSQGIVGVPNLHIPVIGFEFTSTQAFYYPVLFFAAFAAFVAYRLANSRTGRAWNAMREDESVAEATGVNVTAYKLLAFALGATLGCLSGALFAVQLGSVFANSFNILVSITTLAIIILGGMGSIPGVIVGALILIGLPELLREFGEYRLLVYGAVLVAMMITRPEGLFPNRTRRRELHELVGPEDQAQLPESEDALAPQAGRVVTRLGDQA
ncbi:MAG: branched-chain amino acid ABC transporter permease [Candidatus Limnocylindria bacterium]